MRGYLFFKVLLEHPFFIIDKLRIALRLERHTRKKEPEAEPLLNQPSHEIILQLCSFCHGKLRQHICTSQPHKLLSSYNWTVIPTLYDFHSPPTHPSHRRI